MTTSPGQIWAEKFSRSVSKDFKRKKVCSLQSAASWYRWKCTTAPGSSDNSYAHRPPLLNWQILRNGVSCAHVFLQIKYIENCMKLGLSSGIFTESFCHHVSQISHRFWEGWPNYCKHCQRHNGPEGWVHIKVQTQILIKFIFRISTKHQFQNPYQTLVSCPTRWYLVGGGDPI